MNENGREKMIKAGDKVTIKPKHQDPGDSDFEWVATEDEDGGRVKVSPVFGGTTYPAYVMRVEWIEKAAQ